MWQMREKQSSVLMKISNSSSINQRPKRTPRRATIILACQCRGGRSWPKLTWELGRFWNTAGLRRLNFVARGAGTVAWHGLCHSGQLSPGHVVVGKIPWYSVETQQDRSTAQRGSPPRLPFPVQMRGTSRSKVACLRTMWGQPPLPSSMVVPPGADTIPTLGPISNLFVQNLSRNFVFFKFYKRYPGSNKPIPSVLYF